MGSNRAQCHQATRLKVMVMVGATDLGNGHFYAYIRCIDKSHWSEKHLPSFLLRSFHIQGSCLCHKTASSIIVWAYAESLKRPNRKSSPETFVEHDMPISGCQDNGQTHLLKKIEGKNASMFYFASAIIGMCECIYMHKLFRVLWEGIMTSHIIWGSVLGTVYFQKITSKCLLECF